MSTHSVDDLLVKVENEQLSGNKQPVQEVGKIEENAQPDVPQRTSTEEQQELPIDDVVKSIQEEPVSKEAQEPEKTADEPQTSDSPVDEYGNPIEKPRTYTEDEVQRMIRERLSRGRQTEQPTQQQVQQEAQGFKQDPNSEESWETQLEAYVERTIEKREKKLGERQWQEQEKRKQAEFESKFTTGMGKYSDFEKVVVSVPITPTMLMATRNLDNPAAFVYGAAKMHPTELNRISQIGDPYDQAVAIGRLHEKMVKNRSAASSQSKPLAPPKGDMPTKINNQPSLESRIEQYGRQKRK